MSINRVAICGNLTREPDLRYTNSGTAVLNLGIASNDRRRNKFSNEWEDHANFIDCKMFGAKAENVSKLLSKGMKVFIDGKLDYSQWEKDGIKRSKIEIIIDNLDFTVKKEEPTAEPEPYMDDDIPF